MEDVLDRPEAGGSLPGGQRSLDDILTNGYEFDFSQYFNVAFSLWSRDPWNSIAYCLVSAIIMMFSWMLVVPILFTYAPSMAGYYVAAEKLARGEKPTFSDYFGGYKYTGKLLGFSAIVALIFIVYIALMLVGMIDQGVIDNFRDPYFMGSSEFFAWYFGFIGRMMIFSLAVYVIGPFFITIWIFVFPFVVNGKLGSMQAMSMSWKVIKKRFWWFLLYAVLLYVLEYVGAIALYLGLLATVPLNSFLKFAAYHEIVGLGSKEQEVQGL